MAQRHSQFEWDQEKADANEDKHGVSFEQVADALMHDNRALEDVDERYEDRWLTLALSGDVGVLFVVWTEPEEGVTRIISARKATKREKQRYAETNR